MKCFVLFFKFSSQKGRVLRSDTCLAVSYLVSACLKGGACVSRSSTLSLHGFERSHLLERKNSGEH